MVGFNNKYIDAFIAFLKGPIWAILQYRLIQYKNRLQEQIASDIRQCSWDRVANTQGKMDAVDEVIKITKRLDNELKTGQLDVDEALNVMENKTRHEK